MQEALTGINNSLSEINTALAGKAAANHGHNAVTAQAAGFMAAADKAKLDGVAAGATATTCTQSQARRILGRLRPITLIAVMLRLAITTMQVILPLAFYQLPGVVWVMTAVM